MLVLHVFRRLCQQSTRLKWSSFFAFTLGLVFGVLLLPEVCCGPLQSGHQTDASKPPPLIPRRAEASLFAADSRRVTTSRKSGRNPVGNLPLPSSSSQDQGIWHTGRHRSRPETHPFFEWDHSSNGYNGTIYDLDYRWSAWSSFTACSRSCGIGVKSRHRTCYKFGSVPIQVGGHRCRGNTEHYIACNTQPCPPGSRDFRELQCAFFNGQKYAGYERKWRPVRPVPRSPLWNVSSVNPCILICAPEKMSWLVVKFSRVVVDGTSCGPRSICAAGNCIPVGCDTILYSSAVHDRCGVCAGNNSSCYRERGMIKRNISAGYEELFRLPSLARHIKIVERARNNVVLALRSEEGKYLLNGELNNKYPSVTKLVSGAIFYYHHAVYNVKGLETLHAEGPINDTLIVVSFTPEKNTSIQLKYEYSMPLKNTTFQENNALDTNEPSYAWQTLLYSQVLFGHIPSSMRHQILPSTEKLQTEEFQFTKAPFSFPNRESDRNRLHRMVSSPSSSPSFHTATMSTLKASIQNPTTESRLRSRNANYWRNYGHRYHQNARHYAVKTTYQSPLSISFNQRNSETRKHIYVRIVTPSSLWMSSSFTSSTSSPIATKKRHRQVKSGKNRTPGKTNTEKSKGSRHHSKLTLISERREIHRKSRNNQTLTRTQIEKDHIPKRKGIPVFLSALSKMKENLSNYRTIETRSPQYINASSADYNAVKTGGHPLLYSWRSNVISPCSITCDAGIQLTFFSCFNIRAEKVDDKLCEGQLQPDPSYHECTRKECPARWVVGLWSVCSRSCDLGEQVRSVRCWRMLAPGFDSSVHDYLCPPAERPIFSRKCNDLPCGPQWEMSTWSTCSSQCGYGVQRRQVRCNAVEERLCNRSSKPPSQQSCYHPPCVNTWKTTKWSDCNGPCGRGVQHREVMCVDRNGQRNDIRYCDKNTRPLTVQGCGHAPYCSSTWVPQAFEVCSASCGQGIITRKVVCGRVVQNTFQLQSDAHCRHKPRPNSSTPCRDKDCGPSWYVTEWSTCSKTCGRNAIRVREVNCYNGGKLSSKCKTTEKPLSSEACPSSTCPENDDDCKDDHAINCKHVKKIRQCRNSYYKKACCESCQEATVEGGDSGYAE